MTCSALIWQNTRRFLSLDGLVESLLAVHSEGMALCAGPQEEIDLPLQRRAAREQTRHQPQELPAALLAQAHLRFRELLQDLTVNLVT